ncbi:MAG: formyltransferase family protein, partial [Candidatus Baltobacteraceae bacterium]
RTLLRLAIAALAQRGYARALIPAVGDQRLVRYYAEAAGASVAETFERASLLGSTARIVVMASGNGSNLQAVLDAVQSGALPLDVGAVVCNDPRAYALERARNAGVDARVIAWNRDAESRGAYDERLLEAVASAKPELVMLLGWMHLLDNLFVSAFPQTINLHPAFLPLDPASDEVTMPDGTRIAAFRGPHAVRDALAASSRWVGATVHRVTPATDRGAVLVRKPLRVKEGESDADLMERVHAIEHPLVIAAIRRWLYERSKN